jgi:hypothetical protein
MERRQHLRSVFRATVTLHLISGDQIALLHDISLKGAMVEVGSTWGGRVGDVCKLSLKLASDAMIEMRAVVAHVRGTSVGLRCEQLDLESMTHLRQLVEHNADDPSLLERELAALISGHGPRN